MKPHSRSLRAPTPAAFTRSRRAPALLATLVLAGCAGAAPAAPIHVVARVDPLPAPPPPVAAARWVESGGATLIGPVVSEGTLVLLGGRRAIVAPDGSLRNETVASPEPLVEIITVPGAQSGAPSRLVGRGVHGIYRFDEPLGAGVTLARSSGELARIGALPGVVAAWAARSDLPRFLDVSTGNPRDLPGLPKLPMRSVSFLDARRGAAIFEAVGLVTSADGGATWRVAEPATPGDALRMNGLRRRSDALRAFTYADGPEATVDADAAKLGAIDPPAAIAAAIAKSASPLLRWIQTTARDPLEAAASGGIDLGPRGALVASHGLLARVDPRTGAILELVEFAHGKWMNACSAAAAGDGALIACALSEDQGGADLFDPFGVLKVTTGDPLRVDHPIVIRNGDVELRSSPSGGAMILGSCSPESDGEVCVRQSDGKWLPFRPEVEINDRGVGPLADGRVAFLRGLNDADVGAEAAADPQAAQGSGDAPAPRGLHVSTLDLAGHERPSPAIPLPDGHELSRVESPIEEDAEHVLHLVIEAGDALLAVSQPPGRELATVQPLTGMIAARIHAGRGIAVGESRVLASPDGGSTWAEIPVAPRVLTDFREVAGNDPSGVAVSAVGARIGSDLRIGWGPSSPSAPQPVTPSTPSTAAPTSLDDPGQPTRPADRQLACTSAGDAAGAGPLLGSMQIKALLGSKPARKGTRRETSAWASGRAGMLDAVALLEEEGPEGRGGAPASWTLKWFDPTEIGAKPRSLARPSTGSGADASSPPWGASVRFAAASGPRALFALHVGGRYLLVRTKPGGGSETAPIAADLLPSNEVVFGVEKGEAIAWMHESDLVVWISGEAPRSVAQVAAHAGRWLGQPTRDAVPMLLGGPDWAITRALPIAAARPAPPTLDGWTRAPNLRRDVGAFPPCAAKPAGASFIVPRSFINVRIDGVDHGGVTSLYDVRVAGEGACIAAMSALVSPSRAASSAKGAAPPKKGAKPAAGGPVAFVRVDLAGKRAEGGERGTAPAKVHRLTCALDATVTKP
jgi:hypothetical protein